jgi:methionyl-tRNA formyltransferase
MRKLRVLLLGEQAAGVQALRMLVGSPHILVAVMASPAKISQLLPSVWTVAHALGQTTLPIELVKDAAFAGWVKSTAVDLILNVYSLHLIHREVLRAPTLGSFNLHPSPLPRYAGLNSISWAIYHGETAHGVTIHEIVPEIDAGPIAYQTLFQIEPSDNGFRVSSKCTREGIALCRRLLEDASHSGEAIPHIPQDLSQRTCFGKAVPEGGQLSWAVPARSVVNFVRACDFYPFTSDWGNPWTSIAGRELAVCSASLTGESCLEPPGTVRRSGNSYEVATADEWVLVDRVSIGGQLLDPACVIQSGDRLGDLTVAAA